MNSSYPNPKITTIISNSYLKTSPNTDNANWDLTLNNPESLADHNNLIKIITKTTLKIKNPHNLYTKSFW